MKKVLLVNEASTFNSGLGKYGYNLLKRLKERGYKVAELAFGKNVNPPDDGHITWPVYYNNVSQHDSRFKKMSDDPENMWGKWRFDRTCLHFKPDYVLSFSDPWHSRFILLAPSRRYFRYIAMPTADTYPLKLRHYGSYTNPDRLITYSDWAKDFINKHWPGLVKQSAKYGVDPTHYYPLKNKNLVKKNMGLDPNKVIIGMIAKNQPRKLIAELIFTFKEVAKRNPNVMLYLHTSYPDKMGWDIPVILNQADIADKVLLTYTCGACGNFYPSIYKGEVAYCRACKTERAAIKSHAFQIPDNNMNIIMNLFDIYIQYASSEGAGMPVAEAAYCGLPTVVVKTTAMKDYENTLNSYMIDAKEHYTYTEHGFRGLPINSQCADILTELSLKPMELLRVEGGKNLSLAHKNYDWDKTTQVWIDTIESIEPKNMWYAPKQTFKPIPQENTLDAFSLYCIWQDYVGLNDPFNLLKLCRETQNADFITMNSLLCQANKESVIHQINKYIEQLNLIESVRVGELEIQEEDFLDYANIKGIVHG